VSVAKIEATFISRRTGQIIGEASFRPSPEPEPFNPFGGGFLESLNPFAEQKKTNPASVGASSVNYNTDVTQFTDAFSFVFELGKDEDFNVRSHDFVEFKIVTDAGNIHQIGVGFIEKFHRITKNNSVIFQGNGRDLMGQFMYLAFQKQLIQEQLTIKEFIQRIVQGSYIEEYLSLRQSTKPVINDIGAFALPMLFVSDLEQKIGGVLQRYADLAINLVYMNRLGQVEVLGRPGNVGSTVTDVGLPSIGILAKGAKKPAAPPGDFFSAITGEVAAFGTDLINSVNPLSKPPTKPSVIGTPVMAFNVQQDYSNVFSQYTVFYVSGEAIQDQNQVTSPTFQNSDRRVQGHIINPGYRTFNSSDLLQLAGNVRLPDRIRDIAKSTIRKSNRNLQTVIALVDEPVFFETGGRPQVPFQVGQRFTLQSIDKEFTSRDAPEGIDNVEMVIAGINYSMTKNGSQFQLKFVEKDTLI